MKFLKKRVLIIDIKVLIYLHLWHINYKNYFDIMTILCDNNFYTNKFIYLFLLKKLDNFVCFITPAMEKWLIHMKRLVAAPALFFFHMSCGWPRDCSDLGGEEIVIQDMEV